MAAEAEGPTAHRASSGETLNESKEQEGHGNKSDGDQDNEKDDGKQSKDDNEKQDQGPPAPVGFLHKSLRKVWGQIAWKWLVTTVILMAAILAILGMYWAVLFAVDENMASLKVIVVDFDGQSAPYTGTQPIVGPFVTRAAQQVRKPTGTVGWTVMQASEFNFDPIAVRQYIYDEHAWAAVIINNNATALLQQAVQQGNANYDPMGALQTIYVQAVDETTYNNYIIPQLNEFQQNVVAEFGPQWIPQVLSNNALNAATYGRAPQALSPAIGFSIYNLRPFSLATATPAVSIGLIYLIILAFFSFSFYLPIYSQLVTPKGHPPLHFWVLCITRLVMTLACYFFLSLAYSLVSLAFQIPFSNTYPHNDVTLANLPDAYGKGSFVVYWMLNWVGMVALGLASENVTMLIGQPWTSLWLIFWVITNVSTSFYSIALAPGFFKWGYAWPLYHIVNASRMIIFDTHSRIGLSFGVLFAWAAINILLFFPCCIFFRYQNNKETIEKVPRSTTRFLVDG